MQQSSFCAPAEHLGGQRCIHLRLQLPLEAVSVWPTTALPVIVGSAVFAGSATTAAVGLEVTIDEPLLFDAVTLTRRAWPTSPDTDTYDALLAPASDEQPLPKASQRSH